MKELKKPKKINYGKVSLYAKETANSGTGACSNSGSASCSNSGSGTCTNSGSGSCTSSKK